MFEEIIKERHREQNILRNETIILNALRKCDTGVSGAALARMIAKEYNFSYFGYWTKIKYAVNAMKPTLEVLLKRKEIFNAGNGNNTCYLLFEKARELPSALLLENKSVYDILGDRKIILEMIRRYPDAINITKITDRIIENYDLTHYYKIVNSRSTACNSVSRCIRELEQEGLINNIGNTYNPHYVISAKELNKESDAETNKVPLNNSEKNTNKGDKDNEVKTIEVKPIEVKPAEHTKTTEELEKFIWESTVGRFEADLIKFSNLSIGEIKRIARKRNWKKVTVIKKDKTNKKHDKIRYFLSEQPVSILEDEIRVLNYYQRRKITIEDELRILKVFSEIGNSMQLKEVVKKTELPEVLIPVFIEEYRLKNIKVVYEYGNNRVEKVNLNNTVIKEHTNNTEPDNTNTDITNNNKTKWEVFKAVVKNYLHNK